MVENTDANRGYVTYQNMVQSALESIAALSKICGKLDMQQSKQALESAAEKMRNKIFTVGIMGEFSRGKSTVINALLGKEIVPSDIVPTSATLNYVRWDTNPGAFVNFKDGSSKKVSVDEIKDYVTKLTEKSASVAATVEDAVVYYPCPFCQNGVQIVDTPGLNDEESMTQVAEKVIPFLDAMILVIVPSSPVSMSEAEFVRSRIMTSDLGRILFVVNKIDDLETEEERARLLAHVKNTIGEKVLDKIGDIYGDDSEEYKDAKLKVGNVRVIGISAREALRGKTRGDMTRLHESNFAELEKVLSHLLTEERGNLELIAPVNTILSISKEVSSTLQMRCAALDLDKEELKKIMQEGIEQAQNSRSLAEDRIAEMRGKAKNLYDELLPEVEKAYTAIESALMQYVKEVSINPNDVSSNSSAQQKAYEIAKTISGEMHSRLAASTEILSVKIQEAINAEVINFSEKSGDILGGIERIQNELLKNLEEKDDIHAGHIAADSLVALGTIFSGHMGIFGLGGIISGFKANGVPGALVGGIAGSASGFAAAYAVAAVTGSIIGLPALIPALAIGGVVSTFFGKWTVNTLFRQSVGTRNIVKIRQQVYYCVEKSMANVRSERVLEKWLSTTTNKAYTFIADKMESDIEVVLTDFEQTMAQIRLDNQKKQHNIESLRSEFSDMAAQLKKVSEKILPVKEKLSVALSV